MSHRSAARLLNLGDIDADRAEFTNSGRRRTTNPAVAFHRGQLSRGDWTVHAGLPVTTPEKTIETLAASHLDGGHLASVVRDAMLHWVVPPDPVAAVLDRHAHRTHHP